MGYVSNIGFQTGIRQRSSLPFDTTLAIETAKPGTMAEVESILVRFLQRLRVEFRRDQVSIDSRQFKFLKQ